MSTRSPSKPVAHARGRVAGFTRSREPNDPELIAAKQELKALTLAEHVARIVATAPPLTTEQRDTIMAAFVGFTPADGAHE